MTTESARTLLPGTAIKTDTGRLGTLRSFCTNFVTCGGSFWIVDFENETTPRRVYLPEFRTIVLA